MCKRATNCDWGRSAVWGYHELCIALRSQDYKNSSLSWGNKITGTLVLLEEIMASHKPEWHLPIRSILLVLALAYFHLYQTSECTHLLCMISMLCKPASFPTTFYNSLRWLIKLFVYECGEAHSHELPGFPAFRSRIWICFATHRTIDMNLTFCPLSVATAIICVVS